MKCRRFSYLLAVTVILAFPMILISKGAGDSKENTTVGLGTPFRHARSIFSKFGVKEIGPGDYAYVKGISTLNYTLSAESDLVLNVSDAKQEVLGLGFRYHNNPRQGKLYEVFVPAQSIRFLEDGSYTVHFISRLVKGKNVNPLPAEVPPNTPTWNGSIPEIAREPDTHAVYPDPGMVSPSAQRPVRVADFRKNKVLGALAQPLGTVVEIEGVVANGDWAQSKSVSAETLLRVQSVNGKSLDQEQIFLFGPRVASHISKPRPGEHFHYYVHEYGAFDGVVELPPKLRDKNYTSIQHDGFYFRSYLAIHKVVTD